MKKRSEWLRLEKSRNARLWIETAIKATGVAIGAAAVVNNSPELKCKIEAVKFETKKKFEDIKSKFKK